MEDRRVEQVAHRLGAPDGLGGEPLAAADDPEDGRSGHRAVAVRDEHPVRRDEDRVRHVGGDPGRRAAGLPGVLPQQPAVLGSEGKQAAGAEEDDLPHAVDGDRQRRGVGRRVRLRGPDELPGRLVEGEEGAAVRAAGLDEELVALDHRRGGVAVLGDGPAVLGREIVAPDRPSVPGGDGVEAPPGTHGIDHSAVDGRCRSGAVAPRAGEAGTDPMAPQLLAGGGVEADQELAVAFVPERVETPLGDGDARETLAHRDPPEDPRVAGPPGLEESALVRHGVPMGPAPLWPIGASRGRRVGCEERGRQGGRRCQKGGGRDRQPRPGPRMRSVHHWLLGESLQRPLSESPGEPTSPGGRGDCRSAGDPKVARAGNRPRAGLAARGPGRCTRRAPAGLRSGSRNPGRASSSRSPRRATGDCRRCRRECSRGRSAGR